MADLQTDGAQVFSLWHNEGTTSRPKSPRDPDQLASSQSTPPAAKSRIASRHQRTKVKTPLRRSGAAKVGPRAGRRELPR